MKHYVYKLVDKTTGEFYYGSRTCKRSTPDKDSYMGSMKRWKPNKENLKKIIIKSDFNTREEAVLYEAELIKRDIENELNRNYHIPPSGFRIQAFGKDNPNYGKKWSTKWKKEQKKRMKEYYKTHTPPRRGATHTNETKEKMSEHASKRFSISENNPMYGKHHSKKALKNISEACKNQKKVTCNVCGLVSTAGNIKRWHNENCKSK